MKKAKLVWLVIAVTSVAVIIIAALYFFGGQGTQKAELYWWQQDPEIVRVSDIFKSNNDIYADKKMEATLLFPVITIGTSSREVKALLGEPNSIEACSPPGCSSWTYIFNDTNRVIFLYVSDEGVVISKFGA